MNLEFKSDVGGDILQSAELFSHPPKAINEYVKNSAGYIDKNKKIEIDIKISKEEISISDNGRGMSAKELQENFFVMHGENKDRKLGKHSDGLFGTGKSAAFGIAKELEIITIQNNLLNHVKITEEEIKKARGKDRIPIELKRTNQKCKEDNGTIIKIKRLKSLAKKIKESEVENYIKKRLKKKKNINIFINNNPLIFQTPEIDFVREFFTKDFELTKKLKNSKLIIKVSKSPIKDSKGIDIFSKTTFLETSLAGMENKEYSDYIFGEVDIDELDGSDHEIPVMTQNRGNLNPENPIVMNLTLFISSKVQSVLDEIINNEKENKKSLDDIKRKKLCSKISDYLDSHFNKLQDQISSTSISNVKNSKLNKYSKVLDQNGDLDILSNGNEISSNINEYGDIDVISNGEKNKESKNPKTSSNNELSDGSLNAKNSKGSNKGSKKGGGFSVDPKDLGLEENRAKWIKEKNQIIINIGHKQLKLAEKKYGIEHDVFQRLMYEIAFNEYALALVQILSEKHIFSNASEALFEVRTIQNDLSIDTIQFYE